MTNTAALLRRLAAGASATVFAALLAASPLTAHATPKMMSHGKMMHGKMSHGKMTTGKMVYACTECKMYYSPAQAKAMKYTDPMGHKLTKMSKAPAGFTNGSKMGGKM